MKNQPDNFTRFGLTVADTETVQHLMEGGLTEEEACAQIADERAPRPAVLDADQFASADARDVRLEHHRLTSHSAMAMGDKIWLRTGDELSPCTVLGFGERGVCLLISPRQGEPVTATIPWILVDAAPMLFAKWIQLNPDPRFASTIEVEECGTCGLPQNECTCC